MKKYKLFILVISLTVINMSSCDVIEDLQEESNEKANRKQQDKFDKQFETQWSLEERERANTAKNESYLSPIEKEVYYYLNLVRINPPLFGKTYAKAYSGTIGYLKGYAFDERKASLLKELEQMDSIPVLRPDEILFESADCFATEGGKQGLRGHDRSTTGCMKLNVAECCDYGGCYCGLEIIMSLLIDAGENNAALGHRRICLDSSYHYLGVAIRNHKEYGKNAVLDFSWEKME